MSNYDNDEDDGFIEREIDDNDDVGVKAIDESENKDESEEVSNKQKKRKFEFLIHLLFR